MTTKHATPRISAWFYYVCLALCFFITKVFFRLSTKKDPALKKVKGGLLILANHQSYTDPLFVATAYPRRKIHFVAGRYLFENRVLLRLFRALGVIAKQQLRPDAATIRDLIALARKGSTLFMFPEGQRSVDGRTARIQEATGRLVKKLGLPVAVARLSGAYLSWPRWGKNGIRLGKVTQETSLLLTAEAIASLDAETINEKIQAALAVDDYALQLARKKPYRYFGRARAEHLEHILHWCPVCASPFLLKTKDDKLFCEACALTLRVERSGLLSALTTEGEVLPRSPAAWHDTQVTAWRRYVERHGFTFEASVTLLDRSREEKSRFQATCTVLPDAYEITTTEGLWRSIPYDGSSHLFAEYGDYFQLIREDGLIQIEPRRGQAVVACLDLILSGYQRLS